jgi:uncharacterized protein YtpQ (UPF0354 family)
MEDIREFYDRVSKDLSEKYSDFEFELDGDNYEMHDDIIHITIDSHALHSMYINKEIPYNGGVVGSLSYMIDSRIDEFYNDIEYSRIYPILRREDWNTNDPLIKFLRRKLFLDIDVLFTKGIGNEYQCIKENENLDFDKIYKGSWDNVNNMVNAMKKIHDQFDIFTLSINCTYACSMLFNLKIEKEIRKKVGLNYIFIIPTASGLVVAPNIPEYVLILKELIKSDSDTFKVSNRVYGYIDGKYQYMD